MQLAGKSVVITGASSGIGRETALEMARRGARVIAAARRETLLETLATECRELGGECTPFVLDVTSANDCRRLISSAPRVDVLINNAGFAIFDAIEEASADDLHEMMQTNYFGAVHCIQAVLPQMLVRGSGTIVNVASIAGLMGYARMGGYCATKFALVGLSEALRNEVMARGVRVALVCPSTTATEFFIKAERGKMPGASRLVLAEKPEVVARAICNAAEAGSYRRIRPLPAWFFIRLKEMAPRTAHALMRRVSGMVE